MGLGLPELLIILVIVFLVFGAGKLPQVMAQLGKGVQAFREGAAEAPWGTVQHIPGEIALAKVQKTKTATKAAAAAKPKKSATANGTKGKRKNPS